MDTTSSRMRGVFPSTELGTFENTASLYSSFLSLIGKHKQDQGHYPLKEVLRALRSRPA